jgi:hypothetical protein
MKAMKLPDKYLAKSGDTPEAVKAKRDAFKQSLGVKPKNKPQEAATATPAASTVEAAPMSRKEPVAAPKAKPQPFVNKTASQVLKEAKAESRQGSKEQIKAIYDKLPPGAERAKFREQHKDVLMAPPKPDVPANADEIKATYAKLPPGPERAAFRAKHPTVFPIFTN